MNNTSKLKELGFSQYEAVCDMALVGSHPVNGSQLSKISGIVRSRIYDVLRSLISKGYVIEVKQGRYTPMPSDELIRRLKNGFGKNIVAFEKEIENASQKKDFEYVWTLSGYENVMSKAKEMIKKTKTELYTRLFPQGG
jgi:HTH-type transcriptional regulator, sugar sensing transcriptional regulator